MLVAVVVCPQPQTPANGETIYRDTRVGHEVEYVCHHGHLLVGQQVRKCTPEGVWSGRQPFCKGTGLPSVAGKTTSYI